MKLTLVLFLFGSINLSSATSILEQRVIKLTGKKSSVYSDSGVFFWKSTLKGAKVKTIRSFYSKKRGFERVVVDFTTPVIPSIYGHIDQKKQKLYLDVLDAGPDPRINQNVSGKYLKSINVYSLDKTNTSLELSFNKKFNFDIFYLNSPGRLVIDVRK